MKPKICRYCGGEIKKRDGVWVLGRPIGLMEFMMHEAFRATEHIPEATPKRGTIKKAGER